MRSPYSLPSSRFQSVVHGEAFLPPLRSRRWLGHESLAARCIPAAPLAPTLPGACCIRRQATTMLARGVAAQSRWWRRRSGRRRRRRSRAAPTPPPTPAPSAPPRAAPAAAACAPTAMCASLPARPRADPQSKIAAADAAEQLHSEAASGPWSVCQARSKTKLSLFVGGGRAIGCRHVDQTFSL